MYCNVSNLDWTIQGPFNFGKLLKNSLKNQNKKFKYTILYIYILL